MLRPNFRSVAAVVVLGFLTLGGAAVSADEGTERDGGTAQVVNGVTTGFFPAVGALLWGDAESGRAWCSGTLIGCRTFVTAAHCVCRSNGGACNGNEPPTPEAYTVYFQHDGFAAVESIAVHPDYQFPHGDLAVLTLTRAIALPPVALNSEASPAPDTVGTIVGFGNSGGGNEDYGILRSGLIAVAEGMVNQGDGLLGWHFRGPMGDPGSNANTCGGDSGGPLLIAAGDDWMLAGTTSGGSNNLCLTDDVSVDTDIFMYHQWIRAAAGGDSALAACPIPRSDRAPLQRQSLDGSLAATDAETAHSIEVPPGTILLRVAMNGVDDGRANFDLVVTTPTGDDACVQDGAGQFAACSIGEPAPGTWHVRVVRSAGEGPYQLRIALAVGEPPLSCSPTPRLDCADSATRHRPLFTSPRATAGQTALTWRWAPADRDARMAFADPTDDADYAFCVYDDEDNLLFDASLRAGGRWSRYHRGFVYQRSGNGITHARLRTSARNRTMMVVRGRGLKPLARMIRADRSMTVRAQMQSRSSCWETAQILAHERRPE